MKIAVLTVGRSGSTSLYNACCLIRNFTSSHDAGEGLLAQDRVQLKDGHIEIDTRFAWFLGRLGEADTGDCHYVFLTRDAEAIAQSYNRRWVNPKSIIRGYCEGILQRNKPVSDIDLARDMVATVEANIRVFLEDRPHSIINMESWQKDLPAFFQTIGADVDLQAALVEFGKRHNPSRSISPIVSLRFILSRQVDRLESGLRKLLRK